MNTRTIAEAYARALDLGLLSPEVVTRWIDASILVEASPLPELCVASTITDPEDLATALRHIPGEVESDEAHRLLFGHMLQALVEEKASAKCVASELFRMAMADEVPNPAAQGPMFTFYDDLDLAHLGHIGDRDYDAILNELCEFLESQRDGG
ncbi:MAG: hypothetical protein AAF517_08570 [Planctomycetota bacterium]